MFQHVMVDLETFGSTPGSVIAAIGAVAFDPVEQKIGRTFYRVIDPRSAERLGLRIDAETVKWWLKQDQAARLALAESGDDLREILALFGWWFRDVGGYFMWSHGPSFDESIMAAAYRAAGLKTPWGYSSARCTRTVYDLAHCKPDRAEGVHHNALDDARAQALAVLEAYRVLGLAKPPPPQVVELVVGAGGGGGGGTLGAGGAGATL